MTDEPFKLIWYIKEIGIGMLSGCVSLIRFPYNILRMILVMIFWEFTSDLGNLSFKYKKLYYGGIKNDR